MTEYGTSAYHVAFWFLLVLLPVAAFESPSSHSNKEAFVN
jgi:hypothetical protein